jgi:hypothetical protein
MSGPQAIPAARRKPSGQGHRHQGPVRLPLTVLLATPLTVREALEVATAASVATITKLRATSRKIMSNLTVH